jgi:hypothetical protein
VLSTPQTHDNSSTENVVKTFLDSACPMTLPIAPFSPTAAKEAINSVTTTKHLVLL